MLGNEQPLDLYKLFMVVKDKGGYDVVCKNRLWDLVGEEYGLGVKVGSSVELVYSKYLSTLETPLKNVVDGEFPKCDLVDDRVKFGERLMELQAEFLLDDYGEEDGGDSVYECRRKLCNRVKGVKGVNPELNAGELERVYDYIDGRKLCGTNRVKDVSLESNVVKKVQNVGLVDVCMQDCKKNETSLGKLVNHNAAMEIMEGFDGGKILAMDDVSDAANSMPGLSDGSKSCANDDANDCGNDVLVLELSSVNRESFGRKRKRDSMTEMLSWVTSTAKNPCDPVIGSMPEKPKWKSYGNQEIWKKVLLFREAAFLKRDFGSNCEKLSWLAQRMHPCMYDNLGPNYNLRQRIKCDNGLLAGKSSSALQRTPSSDTENSAKKKLLDSGDSQSSLDTPPTVNIPLGPNHQVEIPEWTGAIHESDSKWLGTQIWPLKSVKSKFLEWEHVGQGRQDSCSCQVQGSVECVRFHIAEKRSKLKLELGVAFYQWSLDKVGEEVGRWWTQQEKKKFTDAVKSNPASLDRCFWDNIFKTFPKKSRENLVSYYFNVFLLQRRAYQNRHTPDNIDSDDEESEFTSLRGIFGHQTNKPNSITILSPKKPQTKPHTKGI